jgi:hypothetical protein
VLGALLLILSAAPCEAQPHFNWPSGSFTKAEPQLVTVVYFARVREGDDAFTLVLPQRRYLVGRRKTAPKITNAGIWPEQQVRLRLPATQGAVLLNADGAGLGCVVSGKQIDLGGPIASDVKLDATSGWTFEVRDRQTDALLMQF